MFSAIPYYSLNKIILQSRQDHLQRIYHLNNNMSRMVDDVDLLGGLLMLDLKVIFRDLYQFNRMIISAFKMSKKHIVWQFLIDYYCLTSQNLLQCNTFDDMLLTSLLRIDCLELNKLMIKCSGLTTHQMKIKYYEIFIECCSQGNLDLVKYLVETFELNANDLRINSWMALIESHAHLDVVKYLIETFDLDMYDIRANGYELFVMSCYYGHFNVVKYLIETFEMNSCDSIKNKLLTTSCQSGRLYMIKYLIETLDLNVDDIRFNDNSALIASCRNGHLNVVKYLVDTYGLNINDVKSNDNEAFRFGSLDVIKYLTVTFGLNANDARSDNNYALRMACLDGHLDVVKYLVETFRLNICDFESDDHFALRTSCQGDDFDVVKYLLQFYQTDVDHIAIAVRCLSTVSEHSINHKIASEMAKSLLEKFPSN